MRAMARDEQLAQLRRERIRLLIDTRFDGKPAGLARKSGKLPAQIGHWLSGFRNPNGDTCRQVEEAVGLPRGWLDGIAPEESPVAQNMSDRRPMLKPRLKTWEEAVETRERAPFALEIKDRALGDAHPVGNVGVFVPLGEPQSGDAVLILAADGLPHLRYYEAGVAGEWRGVSSVIGYPPITGEILAVMATSMRRGLYEAM